jgi:hypothetical protein
MKKIVIPIACSLFLISCTYQQADKVAPLENVINKGEKFRITLPENHSTGYMWQINNTFNDKVLDFNFTALEKGKATVNFALIKYNDTTEVKQFIINVK